MKPVRFSSLKHMALSPAHYRYRLDHPFDSFAMRLGRLTHTLALTPESPVVVFDGSRRGAAWKEFEKAHDGEEVYTAEEFETARAMADAVLADPVARAAMEDEAASVEQEVRWTLAGRNCGGRPDWFNAQRVLDLKSTTDAHPERFLRQVLRLGYHAQAAWYMEGIAAAGLADPREATIVAVESKPPHAVTVFELAPSLLLAGRKLCRLWFEQLLVCERSGEWPGYSLCPVVLNAEEDLALRIGGEDLEVA